MKLETNILIFRTNVADIEENSTVAGDDTIEDDSSSVDESDHYRWVINEYPVGIQ